MPLVLVHAGTGVVARRGGLPAEAAVEARARQALVQVRVAQPPSPASATAAGVVSDAVHTVAVLAPALRAVVDVLAARRALEVEVKLSKIS